MLDTDDEWVNDSLFLCLCCILVHAYGDTAKKYFFSLDYQCYEWWKRFKTKLAHKNGPCYQLFNKKPNYRKISKRRTIKANS